MSAPLTYRTEEDAIILALCPDYQAIKAQLPNRTYGSLRCRAFRLGAANRPSLKRAKWQAADDETIRRLYPDYDAIYAALPTRSRWAVKRRAVDLGVTAERCGGPYGDARPWTDDERAQAETWGARIPGRSRFALISFRRRNGIRVDGATKPAPKPKTPRVARPPAQKTSKAVCPAAAPTPRVVLLAVPKPKAWKRQGNEISPRVIAAAAQSRHGIELIATVQRAVPRETWPHLKPLVIEQVALAVLQGSASTDDLAAAVKAATTALITRQFEGAAA